MYPFPLGSAFCSTADIDRCKLDDAGKARTLLQAAVWATLMQRRGDPAVRDFYVTHSGQFREPMLPPPPQLGDVAPGAGTSRPSKP